MNTRQQTFYDARMGTHDLLDYNDFRVSREVLLVSLIYQSNILNPMIRFPSYNIFVQHNNELGKLFRSIINYYLFTLRLVEFFTFARQILVNIILYEHRFTCSRSDQSIDAVFECTTIAVDDDMQL